MLFKNIFLDFDGTISRSGPGLLNALTYMFQSMSIPVPDEAVLRTYIGPPIKYVLKMNGVVGEDVDKAYAAFREYYEKTGIYEMELYEGIEGVLDALKSNRATVHLATAKRGRQAAIALDYLKVRPYFDNVFGAEAEKNIILKKDIIKRAIELLGYFPEDAVMVGDRAIDIEGGRENGFKTIGVLYGYGAEQEILEAEPDYIARDTDELKSILLG
jgi:phosphoglycolate phosphatase